MSIWSEQPELYIRAVALWAKGWSSQQIAVALGNGITRRAVIGKINRNKDKKPSDRRSPSKPKDRAFLPSEPSRPKVFKTPPVAVVEALDELIPLFQDFPPDSLCKWPVGDGPEYQFCGRQRERGSYCAAHGARAYVRPKDRVAGEFQGGAVVRTFGR